MNKILNKDRYIYLNKFKKSPNSKVGFTLLEMLLVIAIIAILAGIVIIAINPGRQLAQARNTQRSSDLRAIHSAVQQYYIDNQEWPTSSLSGTLQEICDADGNSTNDDNNCLNLNTLVPTYLSAIPTDPQAETGTNYEIAINPTSLVPELTAPSSTEYELTPVEVGTTSLSVAAEGAAGNPYTILTAGLLAYWDMNNVSGSNIYDQVGSNDGLYYVDGFGGSGTLVDASTKSTTGVLGNGLTFTPNGRHDGDYISTSLGNINSLTRNNHTISLWFKKADSSSWTAQKHLIGATDKGATLDNRFFISISTTGSISAGIKDYTDYTYVSGPLLSDAAMDEWWHVAMVTDWSVYETRLYINGNRFTNYGSHSYCGGDCNGDLSGKNPTDYAFDNALFGIGNRLMLDSGSYLPVDTWDGSIDEVRVYNQALSELEIQEIYDHGSYELNN